MATNPIPRLTAGEYLRMERAAVFKSEFLDGEVFAMSGASMAYVRIEPNLGAFFKSQLRATPCRSFGSNLRVRVSPTHYFYPDFTVICGQPITTDQEQGTVTNPSIVLRFCRLRRFSSNRPGPWSNTFTESQMMKRSRLLPDA